jgi:hypothetical protein
MSHATRCESQQLRFINDGLFYGHSWGQLASPIMQPTPRHAKLNFDMLTTSRLELWRLQVSWEWRIDASESHMR